MTSSSNIIVPSSDFGLAAHRVRVSHKPTLVTKPPVHRAMRPTGYAASVQPPVTDDRYFSSDSVRPIVVLHASCFPDTAEHITADNPLVLGRDDILRRDFSGAINGLKDERRFVRFLRDHARSGSRVYAYAPDANSQCLFREVEARYNFKFSAHVKSQQRLADRIDAFENPDVWYLSQNSLSNKMRVLLKTPDVNNPYSFSFLSLLHQEYPINDVKPNPLGHIDSPQEKTNSVLVQFVA